MMRRLFLLLPLLLLLALSPLPVPGQASAAEELCFRETGHCIGGRFREYWEQNGGLMVFGYPTSPARDELNRDTGRVHLTQWFERNRFELHPANARPYDVLLGRLGDDRLRQLGVDWATLPKDSGAQGGCLWFEQTRLNVCDQGSGLGFKRYWETHGLEFGDSGVSYRESLALFGLPLTQPRMETNSSGDTVLTQWFERARFEWHPGKPEQYKVLLGLLGNEIGTGAAPQVRAIWVDAFHDGFRTPEQVRQLVADARRGNLNTLIVQVRRRGDAFYQSSIEPRAETADEPNPVPDGFDPLRALIDHAHAQGIEVHAWIAALPVWHSNPKYQTSNPQHVWRRHGPAAPGHENWIMMRRNGDGSLSPTQSLDPGHPAAAQYTLDVALDIVRTYDVDGLHLDYIRYGGADEGYNPLAVERFNQQHGRSGTPAPGDAQWLQWRRDQVTALVRRIYVESTAIKPRLKLSAATITWGAGPVAEEEWTRTAAYARVLQDWRGWLEEGILDQAYAMNYFREYADREEYDQWIAWEKTHQYGRQIIVGPGPFMNYIEHSLAQIERAQQPAADGQRAAGVALYSYGATNIYSNEDYRWNDAAKNQLPRKPWQWRPELSQTFFTALSQPTSYQYADGAGSRTVQTQPVFAQPAPVPPMPWKQAPSSGMLRGRVATGAGVSPDGLRIELEGPARRVLRSDGNGWFGAVGLPPGSYRATLRHGPGYTVDVQVQPGAVADVQFTVQP